MPTIRQPVEGDGATLRRARLACRLSQAELARRLHYSRSYLSHLEHGRRPLLPLLAEKLATVLPGLAERLSTRQSTNDLCA